MLFLKICAGFGGWFPQLWTYTREHEVSVAAVAERNECGAELYIIL